MTADQELFGDALPTYLTRFIGRTRECAELSMLLSTPGVTTICGVGGAGKTRLAVQVAKRLRAEGDLRVCWVPLATTLDSPGIVSAIARAADLTGIVHLDQLAAALGSGRVLVVLDNCEHLVAECRTLLDQLVSKCGDLRVLPTSRIPLGLADEQVYGVPPLGERTGDAGATEAMELFVDRAAEVASGYALTDLNRPIVAEICRALQGSPLAIELAASWIRVLSPRDLLASMADGHATAGSDSADYVEARHRSIQAVLDSSWHWLSQSDRTVIEALGVFVGGFTREAAEAVTDADLGTLSRLSQLALIQRLPDPYGGSRYQVHELIRNYALDRLGDGIPVRRRHLDYFLDRVERTGASRNTPIEPGWRDPLAADLANIDAALGWALEREDAESAQRLAVGLDFYWLFCVHSTEHRVARLAAALALPSPPGAVGAARARAQALLTLGRLEYVINPARSRSSFREAARLFRQVGDAAGEAVCILCRGVVRLLQDDDHQTCRRDGLDSLARSRACGDEQGAAWCLQTLGETAIIAGDLSEATALLSESAAMFAARNSPVGACYSEIDLALTHQLRRKWVESVDACCRALDYAQRHRLLATSADLLEVVARQCVELSRWTSAAQLYGAAASWHSDHGTVGWYPIYSRFRLADTARHHLGEAAWIEAHEIGRRLVPDQALELAGELLTDLRRDLGASSTGLSLRETEVLGLVAAGLTDLDIAQQLVLSPRTVHAHLRSIYRKLNVSSRTGAVAAAGR